MPAAHGTPEGHPRREPGWPFSLVPSLRRRNSRRNLLSNTPPIEQRDAATLRVSLETATGIVRRHVDPGLTVVSERKLVGGSINKVVEWVLDGPPRSVVAKLNTSRHLSGFHREMQSLRIHREVNALTVPLPIAVLEDEPGFDGSGLLMEFIPGVTLGDARLSDRGRRRFQADLADHVARLHQLTRPTFGSALEPAGETRWIDNFRPTLEKAFGRVRDSLPSSHRFVIEDVLSNLESWIPEQATPTLVHGDLWGNNLLIDDRHPDSPRINAFIDVTASYCDPEYELAYLRMFNTAEDAFFERYRKRHPLRSGYDRRFRIYWLATILRHVQVFGEKYVPATDTIIQQIRDLRG